jgi:hypothetical protein
VKDKALCKWLRDNSSGTYRPSAEAATRIEMLRHALNDLLNDCINFGDGKLSDCKMQQAMDTLKDT